MKNLSLVFNVLLLVAVVVLFALHFNKPKHASKGSSVQSSADNSGAVMNIAFFHADSVMEGFDMYTFEREGLEKRVNEFETRFQSSQKQFEKEANEFKERAQYLTITDREAKEEKLYRKQQELVQLQQELVGKLSAEEEKVNKKIFDFIESFLKTYSADNGYAYVFSYTQGGNLWYANESNDITNEMIEALNTFYKKQKAE
jgi:outer membrane protein